MLHTTCLTDFRPSTRPWSGHLTDHEQNLQRVLWLAAGDIAEIARRGRNNEAASTSGLFRLASVGTVIAAGGPCRHRSI